MARSMHSATLPLPSEKVVWMVVAGKDARSPGVAGTRGAHEVRAGEVAMGRVEDGFMVHVAPRRRRIDGGWDQGAETWPSHGTVSGEGESWHGDMNVA
jgi:hypothetical protein